MASVYPTLQGGLASPAVSVLSAILEETSVPEEVLTEARRRRDLVLEIARQHPVARHRFSSGSVAYGTANSPIEDADGGVILDRRYDEAHEFGPDALSGFGPDVLMRLFGEFVLPRLRAKGYPRATVDTSGKRSVKFSFHDPVAVKAGMDPIDPYVDFIIGLNRKSGDGIWIPNRQVALGWDIADPKCHLSVMNEHRDEQFRAERAHAIRLAKRAIKRDGALGLIPVICPWNVCALAVERDDLFEGTPPDNLASLFEYAAERIADGPTADPSPVVAPIDLPKGITPEGAVARLTDFAHFARQAAEAESEAQARRAYAHLYGPEIDAIREREAKAARQRLGVGAPIAGAGASQSYRPTRSDGR